MNADIDGGTVSLLTLDALDVDNKLLTIHLHDLAHLLTFVVTSHNLQHKRPLNVHMLLQQTVATNSLTFFTM